MIGNFLPTKKSLSLTAWISPKILILQREKRKFNVEVEQQKSLETTVSFEFNSIHRQFGGFIVYGIP